MKRYIIIGLLFALPLFLRAQGPERDKEPTRGLAFGLMAHSYGFGLDMQYQIYRDGTDIIVGLGMMSYKHPKELKIESAYADQGGKDYIYDKKNYGYVIAPSVGLSKTLIPKSENNRISIRSTLSAGPLLALLKPYYIEVAIPFSGNQAYVEIEKYDATQHNYTNIVGEADYFLGMNELSVTPGGRAKFSTMLDFSKGKEYIRGIEMSFFADYFLQELEFMDLTDNKKFFFGASIELLIGNKW